MPRANRYILSGQTYHVTHRCHDRSFLLKFAKDRNLYRVMLRERVEKFPVAVLGYCLTSNHVHLLLKVLDGGIDTLGRFMQSLAGDFAQQYNIRKFRSGAFWGDRYHAVMIDGGDYLWRCLRYIDLNMVRAGVVGDPSEWGWCGYQEIMGLRRRYRVIDLPELAESLAPGHDFAEVFPRYGQYVTDALKAGKQVREFAWTESVAVGSEEFVREIGSRIDGRMRMDITSPTDGLWVVREDQDAYSHFSNPKSGSNGPNSGHLPLQLVDALE